METLEGVRPRCTDGDTDTDADTSVLVSNGITEIRIHVAAQTFAWRQVQGQGHSKKASSGCGCNLIDTGLNLPFQERSEVKSFPGNELSQSTSR